MACLDADRPRAPRQLAPLLNAQLPFRAGRAAPAHEQLAARRLAPGRAVRERRRQVDGGVEVDHGAAGVADEVVVRVGAGVVADRAAGVDARGEAEVGEQLEAGVDRRQRDARDGPVDPLQHVLRGRVAAERPQRGVHREALGRDPQAVGAEGGADLVVGGRVGIFGFPNY